MCKHRSLGWFLIEINTIFFWETYGLIWQHTQLGNSISTPPGTTNGRPSCFTLQITNASFASRTFPEGRITRTWVWHSADSEACGKPDGGPQLFPWFCPCGDMKRQTELHAITASVYQTGTVLSFLTSAEGWGQWGQIWKGFEDRVWINLDIGRSF